jgi:CheY-like chemotaxis protein
MTVADGLIAPVVEDDDFQRRTVARMLRALGAREVWEAGDGRQALASMQGLASARPNSRCNSWCMARAQGVADFNGRSISPC